VTAFVNMIAGMGRGRKFTPLLLAHTARSEGSEFAGSAAWENAVRMRWFLGYKLPDTKVEPDEQVDESTRFLCKRKANYTGRDFRQLEYRDGMFDVAPPPTLEDHLEREDTAKKVVLDGVAKLAARGIVASASSNSQEYLPAVLKKQDLSIRLRRDTRIAPPRPGIGIGNK
jgi:hypothetical protein